MPVVSNSSPLISLAAVGQLSLLERLCGQVVIPAAVYAEVALAGRGRPGAALTATVPWIATRAVQNTALVTQLRRNLNAGEAEAIALAVEVQAGLLVIDERRARNEARQLGLAVTGVVGILLEAKALQLIPAIKPVLDALLAAAGYRLSARLYREALRLAGE